MTNNEEIVNSAHSLHATMDCEEITESQATKRVKGKNWWQVEEAQLCRSYLHIGQDPKLGTGMQKTKLWNRIWLHYLENTPRREEKRSEKSLESKFGQIL